MCPSPTNTPILVNRLSIESLFIKRQEFSWNKGSLLVVHILLYGYPRSCVCVDTPGSACIGACATVFRFNPCCTASLDVMLSEVHRDPGAARSASSKRFISPDHLTSSLSLHHRHYILVLHNGCFSCSPWSLFLLCSHGASHIRESGSCIIRARSVASK